MRKKRIALFILVFLVLLHVVMLSLLFQPKKEWSLSEEQKETVMSVAVAYVEENYGTDYYINGNVTISTYTEGGGFWGKTVYDYPMASFIVPADPTQTGVSVHVLVDPDRGKVVKVWTAVSHGIPLLRFHHKESKNQRARTQSLLEVYFFNKSSKTVYSFS